MNSNYSGKVCADVNCALWYEKLGWKREHCGTYCTAKIVLSCCVAYGCSDL